MQVESCFPGEVVSFDNGTGHVLLQSENLFELRVLTKIFELQGGGLNTTETATSFSWPFPKGPGNEVAETDVFVTSQTRCLQTTSTNLPSCPLRNMSSDSAFLLLAFFFFVFFGVS